MFFALSKILRIFIMPAWWLLFLVIWMLLTKSPVTRKRLVKVIIVLLILGTNPFLFRSAMLAWQPEPVQIPKGAVYEAGIVLGGMAYYDKYDRGFFGNNSDRFIQTANLYHMGVIKKILISGGTGKLRQNEPAESFFLREEFIRNGVNAADIIIEPRSRNTYENAVYSKKIIDSMSVKPPYILITSAFHMRRSAAIFKKAGYQFTAYPCDFKIAHKNFEVENSLVPEIEILSQWASLISEMVGYAAYKITGKL